MFHAPNALWVLLLFDVLLVRSTDMAGPTGLQMIALPGDATQAQPGDPTTPFNGQPPVNAKQATPSSDSFLCRFDTLSFLQVKNVEKWNLIDCHPVTLSGGEQQAGTDSLATFINPSIVSKPDKNFEKDLLSGTLGKSDPNDRSASADELRRFESNSLSPRRELAGVQIRKAPIDIVHMQVGHDPNALNHNLGLFCDSIKSTEQQRTSKDKLIKVAEQAKRKAEQQAAKKAVSTPPPQTVLAPGPGGQMVPTVVTTPPPTPVDIPLPSTPTAQRPQYDAPKSFVPMTLRDNGMVRAQGIMYLVPLNMHPHFQFSWPANCDARKLGMMQPVLLQPVENSRQMHISEKVLRILETVGYIKNVQRSRLLYLRRASTSAQPPTQGPLPVTVTDPLAVIEGPEPVALAKH